MLTSSPLALGSKNIVAFGFLYGIVPWVEEVGYVDCFGAQAGIFVAVIGLGMILLIPLGAKVAIIKHAGGSFSEQRTVDNA